MSLLHRILAALFVFGVVATLSACTGFVGAGKENAPLSSAAISRLKSMGSSPGEAMVVRIFKQSSELEVWKRTSDGSFKLFNTYEICAWSGDLGPKVFEGDRQSPEGFYNITPGLMNPKSSYFLSFNTGFPNKFDRAYGRTGSNLMVHGDCSSRGCYAMTNEGIKEIYALARELFKGGNRSFQLQIFPFRMTPANLAKQSASPHMAFWKNIKEGYDRFELTKRPPLWDVCSRKYVFDVTGPNGAPLDAQGACPASTGDAVLMAAVEAKAAADEAALATEVQNEALRAAKAAEEEARAQREREAAAARGEAISGFIGGLFGGGKDAGVAKVVNPNLIAPIPAPRIKRA